MSVAQELHTRVGFCAAFQPLKGSILAPERHVFAQKDGPREKKALTFFHADIPF